MHKIFIKFQYYCSKQEETKQDKQKEEQGLKTIYETAKQRKKVIKNILSANPIPQIPLAIIQLPTSVQDPLVENPSPELKTMQIYIQQIIIKISKTQAKKITDPIKTPVFTIPIMINLLCREIYSIDYFNQITKLEQCTDLLKLISHPLIPQDLQGYIKAQITTTQNLIKTNNDDKPSPIYAKISSLEILKSTIRDISFFEGVKPPNYLSKIRTIEFCDRKYKVARLHEILNDTNRFVQNVIGLYDYATIRAMILTAENFGKSPNDQKTIRKIHSFLAACYISMPNQLNKENFSKALQDMIAYKQSPEQLKKIQNLIIINKGQNEAKQEAQKFIQKQKQPTLTTQSNEQEKQQKEQEKSIPTTQSIEQDQQIEKQMQQALITQSNEQDQQPTLITQSNEQDQQIEKEKKQQPITIRQEVKSKQQTPKKSNNNIYEGSSFPSPWLPAPKTELQSSEKNPEDLTFFKQQLIAASKNLNPKNKAQQKQNKEEPKDPKKDSENWPKIQKTLESYLLDRLQQSSSTDESLKIQTWIQSLQIPPSLQDLQKWQEAQKTLAQHLEFKGFVQNSQTSIQSCSINDSIPTSKQPLSPQTSQEDSQKWQEIQNILTQGLTNNCMQSNSTQTSIQPCSTNDSTQISMQSYSTNDSTQISMQSCSTNDLTQTQSLVKSLNQDIQLIETDPQNANSLSQQKEQSTMLEEIQQEKIPQPQQEQATQLQQEEQKPIISEEIQQKEQPTMLEEIQQEKIPQPQQEQLFNQSLEYKQAAIATLTKLYQMSPSIFQKLPGTNKNLSVHFLRFMYNWNFLDGKMQYIPKANEILIYFNRDLKFSNLDKAITYLQTNPERAIEEQAENMIESLKLFEQLDDQLKLIENIFKNINNLVKLYFKKQYIIANTTNNINLKIIQNKKQDFLEIGLPFDNERTVRIRLTHNNQIICDDLDPEKDLKKKKSFFSNRELFIFLHDILYSKNEKLFKRTMVIIEELNKELDYIYEKESIGMKLKEQYPELEIAQFALLKRASLPLYIPLAEFQEPEIPNRRQRSNTQQLQYSTINDNYN